MQRSWSWDYSQWKGRTIAVGLESMLRERNRERVSEREINDGMRKMSRIQIMLALVNLNAVFHFMEKWDLVKDMTQIIDTHDSYIGDLIWSLALTPSTQLDVVSSPKSGQPTGLGNFSLVKCYLDEFYILLGWWNSLFITVITHDLLEANITNFFFASPYWLFEWNS